MLLLAALVLLSGSSIWLMAAPEAPPQPPSAADDDDPMVKLHPPAAPRITDEQERELLDVLKERMPERFTRLQKLKEESPRMYATSMREIWRWYSGWKTAPRDVQDAFVASQQAQIRISQVVRQIESAPAGERARLRDELRAAVGAEFNADQKIRQYRLGQLQEQLTKLREQMQQRAAQRDRFIDERIDRLLNPSSQPATRAASRPASRPASKPAG
jgi:hypothetical protein